MPMQNFLSVLLLLWLVNFAPPLLAFLLDQRWATPLDRGRLFWDGNPLFGPHKTIRGIVSAVVAGGAVAPLLGFPWLEGAAAALLSMAGDLFSSFLKRRFNLPSGSAVPVLDQVFEGAFPLVVLSSRVGAHPAVLLSLLVIFCVGAYAGSYFFKKILLQQPFEGYPRPVKTRVRFRELTSCQMRSAPWADMFHFEDVVMYRLIMNRVFHWLGLLEPGKGNALNIQTRRLTLTFSNLPEAFDGYEVLLMTDLHLDGLDGLLERLERLLAEEPVDLCLLGGDYRMENYGPSDEAVRRLKRLVPHIRARDGVLAVLGNHDCPEMVTALKDDGVRFLVNEAHCIQRGSSRLCVVGVDDPHYFRADDLPEALRHVASSSFVILLVHSPEIAHQAARYGVPLYLCGHTHAGQIQIPRIGPLFTHSRSPRSLVQGLWKYQGMVGYTSAGVGVSGSPVRFQTHGEIVRITLRKTFGQPSDTPA